MGYQIVSPKQKEGNNAMYQVTQVTTKRSP